MKIYAATWMQEDNQGETLTKAEYPNRLLSFFFLQDEPEERLLEYFTTGENKISARSIRDAKKAEESEI